VSGEQMYEFQVLGKYSSDLVFNISVSVFHRVQGHKYVVH